MNVSSVGDSNNYVVANVDEYDKIIKIENILLELSSYNIKDFAEKCGEHLKIININVKSFLIDNFNKSNVHNVMHTYELETFHFNMMIKSNRFTKEELNEIILSKYHSMYTHHYYIEITTCDTISEKIPKVNKCNYEILFLLDTKIMKDIDHVKLIYENDDHNFSHIYNDMIIDNIISLIKKLNHEYTTHKNNHSFFELCSIYSYYLQKHLDSFEIYFDDHYYEKYHVLKMIIVELINICNTNNSLIDKSFHENMSYVNSLKNISSSLKENMMLSKLLNNLTLENRGFFKNKYINHNNNHKHNDNHNDNIITYSNVTCVDKMKIIKNKYDKYFESVDCYLNNPIFSNENINVCDEDGYYSIHIICMCNYDEHFDRKDIVKLFEYVIENGSDVNVQDPNGWSTLHYLCSCYTQIDDYTRIVIVELLIDSHANVNIQSDMKNTPLHLLCDSRNNMSDMNKLYLLKYFIKNGANVNVQNNSGSTPLHLLCENDNIDSYYKLEMFEYLISHGANVNIQNNFNIDTFGQLCKSNTTINNYLEDMIDIVIDNINDICYHNAVGDTILHSLLSLNVMFDKRYLVSKILDRNFDINTCNKDGYTPLHNACLSSYENNKQRNDMIKYLVNNNANIYAKTQDIWLTPLHCIVSTINHFNCNDDDNIDLINFMINKGVNPLTLTLYGDTPHELLCYSNDIESNYKHKKHDW
jgi:ankyrin repeat protein